MIWAKVADEVAEALGGDDLGLVVALRKSEVSGPPYAPTYTYVYYPLVGVQYDLAQYDAAGTFIGTTGKALLVAATGATPTKSDEVMIDGAEAFLAAPSDSAWDGEAISSVGTVAPRWRGCDAQAGRRLVMYDQKGAIVGAIKGAGHVGLTVGVSLPKNRGKRNG